MHHHIFKCIHTHMNEASQGPNTVIPPNNMPLTHPPSFRTLTYIHPHTHMHSHTDQPTERATGPEHGDRPGELLLRPQRLVRAHACVSDAYTHACVCIYEGVIVCMHACLNVCVCVVGANPPTHTPTSYPNTSRRIMMDPKWQRGDVSWLSIVPWGLRRLLRWIKERWVPQRAVRPVVLCVQGEGGLCVSVSVYVLCHTVSLGACDGRTPVTPACLPSNKRQTRPKQLTH